MIFWPWIYARKDLPGPGSENIAFLSEYLNYETPIGAGVANGRQLAVMTPPTLAPHVIGTQGIGGLLSGQVYSTQLINDGGGS